MNLKRTSVALVVAVLFLGSAVALKYAQGVSLIEPDTARRTIQVMVGLILAAYANLMPKDVGRWRSSTLAAARAQSALRVGGWSMTLAGLIYAGLWAFAPLGFADVASTVGRIGDADHDGIRRAGPSRVPLKTNDGLIK